MENIKGEYCVGTQEETEDILDFANMVFSMSYDSIDFATLLPKAYSGGRRAVPRHHMIKENNKIRALVDSYPVTLKSGSRELKAAYVGTVCVHPNTREKGYMTELMKRAEEDARSQGCALMILDGNRHRYRHYGFERAGIRHGYHARMRNIRHCCEEMYDRKYMETPAYSFEEVDGESPYLDKMFALYGRRNVTARTREDFLLCLQSSHAATYAVLRADSVAGYVNLSADEKNVLEFEMDEDSEFPRVIHDLMAGLDIAELGFAVGADEAGKITYLEKMCDSCQTGLSHQIKILNYEKTLAFLLNWKQKYAALAAGEYVVGIANPGRDCGEKYRICVRDDETEVSRTDREPDTVLGELALVRELTTACFRAGQDIKNAPAGWFPLPFYLPDADAF